MCQLAFSRLFIIAPSVVYEMTKWLARSRRTRRALNYLTWNPDDEPIIRTMLARQDVIDAQNPREAAETAVGIKIPDSVWQEYAPRWERVFNYVTR